jgi:hypothetical protein
VSVRGPESLDEPFSDGFPALECNYTLPHPIGSPTEEAVVIDHTFPPRAEEKSAFSFSASVGSMTGYSFEGLEIFTVDPLSQQPWGGSLSILFKSPSTGRLYRFDGLGTSEMIHSTGNLMGCDAVNWNVACMYLGYHKNISEVMGNLALTLSNHTRNPNERENMNATMFNALAFFSEVYIAVRWGWVLLPLAETALVAVLLVAVILSTTGEPANLMALVPKSTILCISKCNIPHYFNPYRAPCGDLRLTPRHTLHLSQIP